MMDIQKIRSVFDLEQRKDNAFPGARREVLPDLVRYIDEEKNGEGAVIYTNLSPDSVDETIAAQVAYFESIGQDFEWKVYDYDNPPNLRERLLAHGFEDGEAETVMVLEIERAAGVLLEPVRHDIRRIADPARIHEVRQIEEQVWQEEMDGLISFLTEMLKKHPDHLSLYVAYVDENPASTAWIFYPQSSQFASLWGGSTLPAYRKLGLYTSLLAIRLQEARQRGYRYLTVDASPMSRPILEKFGFRAIGVTFPLKWRVKKRETTPGGAETEGAPG